MHAEAHLKKIGFVAIDEWRSCFRHPKLDLLLIVYVDDFKMASPVKNMGHGWKSIHQGIQCGDPEPVNRFLGCEHRITEAVIALGSNPPHGSVPKPQPKPQTEES